MEMEPTVEERLLFLSTSKWFHVTSSIIGFYGEVHLTSIVILVACFLSLLSSLVVFFPSLCVFFPCAGCPFSPPPNCFAAPYANL